MAKIKFSIVVFIFSFFWGEGALADTYLPMAQKAGGIDSPRILAERMRKSLVEDPSGNGRIEGANTSPNGFLRAIQHARGTVGEVGNLPDYLDSLVEKPMPEGELRMSHVVVHEDGSREIDTERGTTRTRNEGEQGWFDPNTGRFVLAGDCGNSPLAVHITIRKAGDMTRKSRVVTQRALCPLGDAGDKYLVVRAFESRAASDACARKYMLPQEGMVSGRSGDYTSDDRFSAQCGKAIAEGGYALSAKEHHIEVVLLRGEEEDVFFEGILVGDVLSPTDPSMGTMVSKDNHAVLIPREYKGGVVVARFLDEGSVRTPVESGIGKPIDEFMVGCRAMVFTAIDAM